MFMSDPRHLFAEFEDLLEDGTSDSKATLGTGADDEDNETIIHKLDANSLTLKDLLHEMEIRGLQPRGFFADDAKVLQTELDNEHEKYLETKRRERREAREFEAKQAILQHRKILVETQIKEEENEIKSNCRIAGWFALIQNSAAPDHCRVGVNDISARSLARLLWTYSTIISLDVSNMGLSDLSGAYLSRALKNNRSIVKIEMGGNMMGVKTCKTLADALRTNNIVKCVNLESNPLTAKNDITGIEAMANMLRENRTLHCLSLWRCNVGVESGRLLSDAMASNNKLICFECGYNGWENIDVKRIDSVLIENRRYITREREMKREVIKNEKDIKESKKKLEEEEKRQEQNIEWIEKQKIDRSRARREAVEHLKRIEKTREEIRRNEEERKTIEQKKRSEGKSKKKKKGKKGGKAFPSRALRDHLLDQIALNR